MNFFKRDKLKGLFNKVSSQGSDLLSFASMALVYGVAMGGPIGGVANYILIAVFVMTYCMPHTYARLKQFGRRFKRAA